MAKVHNIFEMWQDSQNPPATEKGSGAHNKQVTAVGYVYDTDEIVKELSSVIRHDGVVAFKSSGRSPLPPPFPAKDTPGGQTQIFNVRQIWGFNCYPVTSDEESAPEGMRNTEDWLNRNRDLDNRSDSEDDFTADVEPDSGQQKPIQDPEYPDERDVSATANFPRLIRARVQSKRQAQMVLMTVIAIETRRNQGLKEK